MTKACFEKFSTQLLRCLNFGIIQRGHSHNILKSISIKFMEQRATRTKIVCTMGPAVNSYDKICQLMNAGMNVARLNFSHGTHEEHFAVIEMLKKARRELGQPLAIMLDTKGPEVRLGKMVEGGVHLEAGDRWVLTKESLVGDKVRATIVPSTVIDRVPVGATVLFDNGYISTKVVEKGADSLTVEVLLGGVVKSGKGVNIPNESLHLPAVTQQDIEDIRFGCAQDIDLIAASFIRNADHVVRIKKLLVEEKHPEILVIAKIENFEGVEHFDSIVQAADGIMIARGDLGVEVPLALVPKLQKEMIRKSYMAGKPVVTATQMLETMIEHSRPTRAETSDVANAIYDSTSAVMLSGETAIGKYPIKTVETMQEIIRAAESDFDFHEFFDYHSKRTYNDVTSAITLATVKTAYNSDAKAIFAFTSSGLTARLISRLRPQMPIIALTPNQKSYHQLAFNWGVTPVYKDCATLTEAFNESSSYCLKHQMASYGDLVVVTAGTPFGIAGTTNMMIVESIGDVLVRGEPTTGRNVHGNVQFVPSSGAKQPFQVRGQIIVLSYCDDTFEPLIQEAKGVILQNHIEDTPSEKWAMELSQKHDIPLIVRADGATMVLNEGQLVTLDPEKGLVYKGVVL